MKFTLDRRGLFMLVFVHGRLAVTRVQISIEWFRLFIIYSVMFAGIIVLLAIVGAIYVGYYYRTKKESSLRKSIGMGCLAYFIFMPIAAMIGYASMSEQEKAEFEAEQARQDSIQTVREAEDKVKEEKEYKKTRAYIEARQYLKDHLRDPDSYKEEGYSCTIDTVQNIYTVNIKYRARNGFGGMNRSVASFKVLVSDKGAVIIESNI